MVPNENPPPTAPDSGLVEPLLAIAELVPSSQVLVSVVAPANLPEGYVFQASVELQTTVQKVVDVKVPAGGVSKGQTLVVPVNITIDDQTQSAQSVIHAPTGRWKDGLFDCFRYGFFHPSLWCALCCNEIAMAQIMTRMNLNFCGTRVSRERAKNTFKVVLLLYILYMNLMLLGDLNYELPAKYTPEMEAGPMLYTITHYHNIPTREKIINVLASLFALYFLIALIRTRRSVRDQYSIPSGCLGCCEDFCCSAFCGCCAVSQMARHTGDYESNNGVCCSDRGLPKSAPLNMV